MPLNPVPNYPASLDSLPDPTNAIYEDDDGFEIDLLLQKHNAILEALEAKLGIGNDPAAANEVLVGSGAGATHFRQILAADITAGAVMRPIYDTELGVDAASFDVTSITSAYRSLMIQLLSRSTTAAASTTAAIRFNNDSSAIYDVENLQAVSATVASAGSVAQTSALLGTIPAASATSGLFGQIDATIAHYTGTTANKSVVSHAGAKVATGTPAATDLVSQEYRGWWRSSAAISRITIFPLAGNFLAGTRLTIWGLPL